MKICGLQKLTLLDFPGRIACTVFLGGCNFRCPFCHNGSLVLPDGSEELIGADELLAFLDSRRGRLQGVCISGGEPTLHRGLPDLLREIKARGFETKLDTNGTNPEMLSALISGGLVDYVAMDIKNSREKYLQTAGLNAECSEQQEMVDNRFLRSECAETRSNASEVCPHEQNDYASRVVQNAELLINKVKESVALLMQGAVDFEFRTTLVQELHTAEDVESIGKWLSGDEKFFLQTYRDEGDLLVGGFTAFTPEETRALLGVLRLYIPNAEIR